MTNKLSLMPTVDDYRVAQLAALAIGVHILESAFPSPLPGLKPGLANVITIAVFFLYGWRMAAWVSLLRVVVGSLAIGTFMSPTFMLSLAGAVAGLLVLAVVSKIRFAGVGPLGVSVLMALAHMAGQFYLAYVLFIPHHAILNLLPLLMSFSLIFGLVSGYITQLLLQRVVDSNNEPQH